jgi:secreted trypsin-like serine protease
MRFSWVVLTGLAVTGCQGSDAEIRQAIVAGAVDTGDPAIMELLSFRGNLGARCTATLVTPRILVMAAHCFVETPGFTQRLIFPGNDDRTMKSATDGLAIDTFAYDPAYTMPRQGHDFAIAVLKAPLSVPPMRINRASIDQAQGKMVRYVGYGQAVVGDQQSGGVKRQNTAPLAMVSRLLLSVAQNPHGSCEGDSGGPLLLDDGQGEALVGVASFVTNPACLRDSYYQRVDTQLAWLDAQIQKYDPGGMAPAADAGAGDAAASAPDAAPERPADAQAADAAPAKTMPMPDAGPRDLAPATVEPEPPPEGPKPASGAGGCSYGGGSASGVLLVVLAGIGRRRSRVSARP